MSDIYSKSPPTEPGWYWVSVYEGCFPAELTTDNSNERYWVVSGLKHMDKDILWFGPRIPSAEELAAQMEGNKNHLEED